MNENGNTRSEMQNEANSHEIDREWKGEEGRAPALLNSWIMQSDQSISVNYTNQNSTVRPPFPKRKMHKSIWTNALRGVKFAYNGRQKTPRGKRENWHSGLHKIDRYTKDDLSSWPVEVKKWHSGRRSAANLMNCCCSMQNLSVWMSWSLSTSYLASLPSMSIQLRLQTCRISMGLFVYGTGLLPRSHALATHL